MSLKFRAYAKNVVARLECDDSTKKRIKEDIMEMLEERSDETGIEDPIELIGEVKEVAEDFSENLESYLVKKYERISSIRIMGLPLYHITNDPKVVAKGIFAVGARSIGVVSIGAVSVGVISFGGVTVGIIGLGGISVAVLAAFGGVAVAYDMAFGGIAVAKSLALGGLAVANDVAIGGTVSAKLMAYRQSYIVPKSLDEGSAFAYKFPVFAQDFKAKFNEVFNDFGLIKSFIVRISVLSGK